MRALRESGGLMGAAAYNRGSRLVSREADERMPGALSRAGAMMMAAPGSAGAVVVMDQLSQVPTPSNFNGFYGAPVGYADPALYGPSPFAGVHFSSAQSITANAKGKLDHIDLSVLINYTSFGTGSGNLVLSLIDGDYASGARTIIGQSKYDMSTLPPYINPDANLLNFTFQTSSFNYHVKNGQKFSILFDTEPNATGQVSFSGGYAEYDYSTGSQILLNSYIPNYAGGQLSVYADGTDVTSAQGVDDDLTFASYVDTSAGVPEPATWALMILGFGGIGAALRTNRRRRTKRAPALTAA